MPAARLIACSFPTPLGPMLAASIEEPPEASRLCLLEFTSRPILGDEIAVLEREHAAALDVHDEPGTDALAAIRSQLERYFAGSLRRFDVPLSIVGTEFQRRVWEALRQIPFGSTVSYARLAARIGRPAATRAVGTANGANRLAIVVPCHRVIASNGSLGGYGGGLERKRRLLELEHAPGFNGDGLWNNQPTATVRPLRGTVRTQIA